MTSRSTLYTLTGMLGVSVAFIAFDDGPSRKAFSEKEPIVATPSTTAVEIKEASTFHQTYFTNVEVVSGKGLPVGLEDVTLHLFLQIHDGDGINTDDTTANCQLGIYRQLEALYRERKISGVFFEGYRLGFDYISNMGGWGWSDAQIQRKKQELVTADDEKLKSLFKVAENEFGDHNDASELFPVQYGKRDDLVVTGWEDKALTPQDMVEFGTIIGQYGALYNLPHRTAAQEEELKRLEPQALTLVGRHQDRTRQAYNNSLQTMANLFAVYPSLPRGYAVIIGAGHADDLSLHGSAEADIMSTPLYPNAKIYRCNIE